MYIYTHKNIYKITLKLIMFLLHLKPNKPTSNMKQKVVLLVKLLGVLTPVSHILSPPQIFLTPKGTSRWASLCQINYKTIFKMLFQLDNIVYLQTFKKH